MSDASTNSSAGARPKPVVWYVAAGYKLPAGVEAYLLHYATELRRQGFDTRIIVFERLPRPPHRYLTALRERGIPIESLYAACAGRVRLALALTWLPWAVRTALRRRRWPEISELRTWLYKKHGVARLRRMIAAERPDLIHVKARLIAEAWPVFPSERTVYQHALSGTLDDTWTASEVDAFRAFLNRVARVFAPGQGVADTLAREVGVARPIDALFTMAPDEHGKAEGGDLKPESQTEAPLRFGIVCRFAPQKGIASILEALRQYRDRHGDVDFTFAGQGEMEPEIRRFAGAHGLSRLRIARVQTPAASLRTMDVFVHPGIDDAMPVAIVEALMCGVPCIATRVGGVPDLVRDGVEGFLIEPGSAAPILTAMERFAAMPVSDIVAFRCRARARYEACCRPEQVGAAVAGHYRCILKGVEH